MLGRLLDRPQNTIQATPWGDWGDDGAVSHAGSSVSLGNATNLLTVYGCNRFICDGISTLPIHAFTGDGGGRQQLPTPPWVLNPTPDLDFIAWATQVLTSWLLAGNTYVVPFYGRGEVQSLTPLNPRAATVTRENGRKMVRVNGRDYTSQQILHVPGVMFPGDDLGMSPIEAARQMIGSGMSAEEFAGRFFEQGSILSGVIEVPGELEPAKAREMARSWAKKHSGKAKSHLPGVLQGGAMWKPMGVTNEQAQFLQMRSFTATAIAAQLFLIDPAEMGLAVQGTSLTYTNQEERSIRKVQVTFLPWIIRLENLISSFMPDGQYVKLNVAGLLRGDMKSRFESYKTGLDEDFITIDEVRGWEELPPLPERAATPPSLTEQIEAVGQLIRAGFDPGAALEFLGLPPIQHTGTLPITVQPEEAA